MPDFYTALIYVSALCGLGAVAGWVWYLVDRINFTYARAKKNENHITSIWESIHKTNENLHDTKRDVADIQGFLDSSNAALMCNKKPRK